MTAEFFEKYEFKLKSREELADIKLEDGPTQHVPSSLCHKRLTGAGDAQNHAQF